MASWWNPIHPKWVTSHRDQALLPGQVGIVDGGHRQPQTAVLSQADQMLAEASFTRTNRSIESKNRALAQTNQPLDLSEHGQGQPLQHQGVHDLINGGQINGG